jgi:large subunit ribosomal protein L32
MAHPKRRQSSTRRDKRRTHDKAVMPQIAVCGVTGEAHLYHRAYWHEGNMYYKGKLVIDNAAPAEAQA